MGSYIHTLCAEIVQEDIKDRKLQLNAPKIRTKKHASNRIMNNGLLWKQFLIKKAELLTSKVNVESKIYLAKIWSVHARVLEPS